MKGPQFVRVAPKERVPFKCIRCGQCCRHVHQSVPVESLDAYRMAKYLRAAGKDVQTMDDLLERYAEPAPIHASGYFMFFLKTKGPDASCIFLEDDGCAIHPAKPRACRLYPFTVNPENGQYLLTRERGHHFQGPDVQVKTWMKKRFTEEDRAFVELDYGAAGQIGSLLMNTPERCRKQAVFLFLRYKYSEFDLDRPFLEQFERNQARLLRALMELSEQEKQ